MCFLQSHSALCSLRFFSLYLPNVILLLTLSFTLSWLPSILLRLKAYLPGSSRILVGSLTIVLYLTFSYITATVDASFSVLLYSVLRLIYRLSRCQVVAISEERRGWDWSWTTRFFMWMWYRHPCIWGSPDYQTPTGNSFVKREPQILPVEPKPPAWN